MNKFKQVLREEILTGILAIAGLIFTLIFSVYVAFIVQVAFNINF